jgi:hypothetical protein
MFLVELLGDERAKLHTVCDEKEQPVEEDYTIGVARAPVFDVLDIEDDDERNYVDGGGPKAEIPSPDACEILDLEGCLYSSCSDESSKCSLFSAYN